jgi:hypothetical protein
MPTSTAPPRRPRRARREAEYRRDRHRTRCPRSSRPREVALARYYDPTIGRFTAVDPIINTDQPGSLDRFGYGLGSPVTLSDPTGLRVPVDDRKGPDQGGSYDRRRPVMLSKATGRTTRLRMPRDEYASTKGVYVRYAAAPGTKTVTPYAMARMMFRNNNPWLMGEEFGRVEGLGAHDSCIADEGACRWRSVFLTWDVIRQAGIDEAEYQDLFYDPPTDSQLLLGLAIATIPLTAGLSAAGASTAATYSLVAGGGLAVASEAAEPGPCKSQRVAATAMWEIATAGVGHAITEAGHAGVAYAGDLYSEGFSPADHVSC